MMSFAQRKLFSRRIGMLLIVAVVITGALVFQQRAPSSVHAAPVQYVPVPLVTQEALNNGHTGGEGAQWIRSGIGFSPVDTNFAMFATDVGGVWRTLDGGSHWTLSSNGWHARGGTNFAFDPHNANRVLGVGGNSLDDPSNTKPNGVYLSTNKADSWTQVLPHTEGPQWRDTTIAYDPSSYNASLGYTTTAYYITKNNGLYKTTDGGQTWNQINTQFTGHSGFRLEVHPTQGYVYVVSNEHPDYGTANGFYKSTDGGATFVKKADGYTLGLDISAASPDRVVISGWSRVLVSNDAGETFQQPANQGLPTDYTKPLENVTVSPADANYMSVWWAGDNWDFRRYYTKDGGATWGESFYGADINEGGDKTVENSIIPLNARNGVWGYHPTNPNIVLSTGGDWISRSTDGGANYQWSNNGYNAIFVGPFNFNPNSPDTMVMTSKDYSAFTTTNGGQSWDYAEITFDWGGYTFAGMAMDSNVMWLAEDERIDSQGPAFLKVSTDGGQTWHKKQYNGADIEAAPANGKFDVISSVDPTNNDIGFIGKWRTTDHANSWTPMSGVEQVYTYNPTGSKELYGRNGSDIVTSSDHGASWSVVATVPGGFRDLAYDHINNRFWVASEDQLKLVTNGQTTTASIPTDQYNTVRVKTVAVDPVDSNIVYVGNNRDLWSSSNSLVRSTNGGQSWENLTVNTNGPREVWWIRVHPTKRDVWMSTSCFGIWKVPGPGGNSGTGTGLKAEYYNNRDANNTVAHTRTDETVNFDWGWIPAPNVNYDNFSVRWTGKVQAPTSGNYTFSLDVNDGARLWVNNQLVIDYWNDNRNNWNSYDPVTRNSNSINLTGGTQYNIKLEFYDNAYGGTAKLSWSYPGQSKQIIPKNNLYPAA